MIRLERGIRNGRLSPIVGVKGMHPSRSIFPARMQQRHEGPAWKGGTIISRFQLTAQEAAFLRAMDRMRKLPIMRLYPNLSPPEVHLMACVLREPDGRTVSSLTKALDMPMPAVSRLMRGMEERGLITRSILPQDRRSIVVRVTAEGERLLDEFQASFHAFFEEVVNVEDPGDFDQAITGWNRLLDRMESLLMERPAPKDGKEECPPPPPCDQKTITIDGGTE